MANKKIFTDTLPNVRVLRTGCYAYISNKKAVFVADDMKEVNRFAAWATDKTLLEILKRAGEIVPSSAVHLPRLYEF